MDYSYIRYAVCWSPARYSALGEFGLKWTGWCPEDGVHADLADKRGLKYRVDLPEAQANRGLIANIRSPFRLAEGRSRWALERALDALVQKTPEIAMPDMVPMISGGRIVMAPNRVPQDLARFVEKVGDTVRLFQAVPAPATPRVERLPEDDLTYEDSGQPAETFHIAMTGRLEKKAVKHVANWLGQRVKPMLDEAGPIRSIDLMGDPGEGRPWRLVDRYWLASDMSGHDMRPTPDSMTCLDASPVTAFSGSNWDTVIA